MKLLLAGLLVFGGMLLTVGLLGDRMETWPPVASAALVLVGASLPAAFALRFLRGGDSEVRRDDLVATLHRRVRRGGTLVGGPLDHRVEFVATARDGLRAERARRRHATGLRGWMRGAVLAMGGLWLAGFFLTLPSAPGDPPPRWVWLALGSLVLLFFLVLPGLRLVAAWRDTTTRGTARLRVTAGALEVETQDAGPRTLRWRHVAELAVWRPGVLFRFDDGRQFWVPRRAFADAAGLQRFVADVEERFAQERVRQEQEFAPHPDFPEFVPGTIVHTAQRWEADGGLPCFEVELRADGGTRRLRFERPDSVELLRDVPGDVPEEEAGVLLLAIPFPELDGLSVLAIGSDARGTAFVLAAESVAEVAASVPAG